MRSNLDKRGKLIEPKSLGAAADSHRRCAHEIKRIEGDLADKARAVKLTAEKGEDGYAEWVVAARNACAMYRKEMAKLAAWIVEHDNAEHELLRRAHAVFKAWQVEFVGDLNPEEEELLAELDKHFKTNERRTGGRRSKYCW